MLQANQAPRSYVEDQDAEWRTRKISVMGTLRSFVSQLRPGQELTKVSIPVQLLFPFSILEVVAYRELSYFDQILPVNTITDPLDRMLCVVRWYLCTIQAENWHKKPYNPVLGETHYVWTQSAQSGKSSFYAEQVSHHPPVSAYTVRNEQEQITMEATAGFSVKFAGNYVTVTIEGSGIVTLGKLNGEKYLLSRRVPDNKITNVIIGTRRMFWVGDVSITCPQTGYVANLTFKEKSNDNFGKAVVTTVKDPTDELVVLEGKLSSKFTRLNKGQNKPEPYFNVEDVRKPRINYLPTKDLEPFSSMVVWADANRFSVDNLEDKAEESKRKVESDQRARNEARKQSGEEYVPKMFAKGEAGWAFRDAGPYKGKGEGADDSDEDDVPFLKPKKKEPIVPPSPLLSARSGSPPSGAGGSQSTASEVPDSPAVEGKREKSPSSRVSMKIDSSKVSAGSLAVSEADVDPKANILTGWIKLRNAMKNWKNRWFVLRAGRLIYYKAEKSMAKDHCVGILQLADCRVTERATVKEGFSFRIDNIFGHSIYEKRGLKGESIKMAKVPVGVSSAILLVGSEQERRTWMSRIQDQINYATDTLRQKSVTSVASKSADAHSPHAPREALDEDEDDDDDDATGLAGALAKNREMQKEYFQGLFLQQQKQMKTMMKLFGEVDEHLTSVEKKLSTAVIKSKEGSSISAVSIILYTFVAAILVMFFQRLLARYIFRG